MATNTPSNHCVGLAPGDADPDLFSMRERQRTWTKDAVS
jgi:hypothetical protein